MMARVQSDNRVWAWHFHHQELAEPLWCSDSLAIRRDGIKHFKPPEERRLRLLLLRLIRGKIDLRSRYKAASLKRLHGRECRKCPRFRGTIFHYRSRKNWNVWALKDGTFSR